MNKALTAEIKKYYEKVYEPEDTEEIRSACREFEEELEKHVFDFETQDAIYCKASTIAVYQRYKGFIDGYSFCLTMLGMNGEG